MSEDNQESERNLIWGQKFTRLSAFIVAFAILLATSRYVYLKWTGQYPVNYEKQDIIQFPHLEQLEKQKQAQIDSSKSDTIQ